MEFKRKLIHSLGFQKVLQDYEIMSFIFSLKKAFRSIRKIYLRSKLKKITKTKKLGFLES